MSKQITKDKFIELYNKMTIKDMAKHLKVSRPTITNWAKKLELPPKLIRRNRNKSLIK